MRNLRVEGPNAEQIEYWNDAPGARWVSFESLLDAQLSPLGRAAMERADIRSGARVLDVGCGCGQTSLQLAARVGPGGEVTGLDLSAAMLERARARAVEEGLANVCFLQADAQSHAFPAKSADLVFSRFGVMFFADPRAAFANLAKALAPGGRVAFVCWQGMEPNEWLRVPLMAAARHLELPPPPAPGAPGPLSFADPERVRGILGDAGLRGVAIEPLEGRMSLAGGGPLAQVVEFILNLGPTARLLRDAEAAVRERVAGEVRRALEPYASEDGVRMGYGAWIVTATV